MSILVDPVGIDDALTHSPLKSYNAQPGTGQIQGWQHGALRVVEENSVAGVPAFNGPYSASWNWYVASVMRDSAANYITGTYVQSWSPANGSMSIAGLNTVKFARVCKVHGTVNHKFKLVTPSTNTYVLKSQGLQQPLNTGSDWTESHHDGALDINTNAFFGTSSIFDALIPNDGDGIWVAVRPQPANTSALIAPQVCLLAYSFDDVVMNHTSNKSSVCACSSFDLATSTVSPATEYNARQLKVDFSMMPVVPTDVTCNDEFMQMLSWASLKLTMNGSNMKWISTAGLTVELYTGSRPTQAENSGSLVATLNGLTSSMFSTPNPLGEFNLIAPRACVVMSTGMIGHAKIIGSNTTGAAPAMWVNVNVAGDNCVTVSNANVSGTQVGVTLTELAFRFKVTT